MERRLRLRNESEVRTTRAQGKAFADGPLVARVRRSESAPTQNRYTVVAGKRVGKSVQRNRVKRVVREALRALHPSLTPGHDIVVIVRGTVEELPDLQTAVTSLNRIVRRARLLREPSVVNRQPSEVAAASATPVEGQSERPEPVVQLINTHATTES